MTDQQLAAELAARVPELARDCVSNREELILGLLKDHREPERPLAIGDTVAMRYAFSTEKMTVVGITGDRYALTGGGHLFVGSMAEMINREYVKLPAESQPQRLRTRWERVKGGLAEIIFPV